MENPALKEKYSCQINTGITELSNENINDGIKTGITTATQNNAQEVRPLKKRQWMTDGILNLMEKPRQHINQKYNRRYKETQILLRRKIKQVKDRWMIDRRIEIEELQDKRDSFGVHRN